MGEWRPIETAPSNRKLIAHYKNVMGKDRTVFAICAERGAIEIFDSDDYEEVGGVECLPVGWWEIVESPDVDFCFVPLGAEPTHWQPLPAPPEDTDHGE